jgi:hypothetical protein
MIFIDRVYGWMMSVVIVVVVFCYNRLVDIPVLDRGIFSSTLLSIINVFKTHNLLKVCYDKEVYTR